MPNKKFQSAEEERIGRLAMAYFRSAGVPVSLIPKKMGMDISPGAVRNHLDKAAELGVFRRKPTLLVENIPWRDMVSMRHRYFDWEQLDEKLASWTPRPPTTHVQKADDMAEFSSMAAESLASLLKYSNRVGVLGGVTLASIAREYRSQVLHNKGSNAKFTPLSGTCTWVLRKNNHELDASAISSQFEEVFNRAVDPDDPVLAGVPAYIGTNNNIKAIKAYIESMPGYSKIFSYPNRSAKYPLIEHIDTIVTGIGAFHKVPQKKLEAGEYLSERAAQEDISIEELSDLVYGDIGGHLLKRDDLPKSKIRIVDKFNDNWMGIKRDHFKQVAESSHASKKPGCVVIAYHTNKASAIKAAIERGYVKNLIISDKLGHELLKR